MAVRDRRLVRTLQFDPVVVRLFGEHEPFQRFMSRLYRVLLNDADDDNLIQVAMLSGAISSAVMHPLVGDIDDETLRSKLTDFSRRLIDLSLTTELRRRYGAAWTSDSSVWDTWDLPWRTPGARRAPVGRVRHP